MGQKKSENYKKNNSKSNLTAAMSGKENPNQKKVKTTQEKKPSGNVKASQKASQEPSAALTLTGERKREHWRSGNMLYPVPAVMVSCGRPGEKPNIITVAWAGTVCSSPAMVSISVRPERYSYDIIRETGEFVINLTTEQLAFATDFCGVRSGRDVDKFEKMGLTAGEAVHVAAPIIEESPVNIECRVTQVLELGSHHMFVAEVLGVDVDARYLDERGKLLLNKAGLMVYSHGEYFGLGKNLGKFGYSVRKNH